MVAIAEEFAARMVALDPDHTDEYEANRDAVDAAYAGIKPFLALYMGGMGSEDTNFHAEVYRRMGYSDVVDEVTELFRAGRKAEAAAIIPDAVVDDSAIVGDEAHVRAKIVEWEEAGVSTMLVSPGSVAEVDRLVAAIPSAKVLVLCETARGILAAPALAAHPDVVALMWGGEDLVADLERALGALAG